MFMFSAIILFLPKKYIHKLYYPNAIKWLPTRVGFGGSDIHNLTLVIENTKKKVVSN